MDKYESYKLTPHSRALNDIHLEDEPPDGSFEHHLSKRTYRVYRKDGQLRHQEVLRTNEGQEFGKVDLPVRYVVGSGNFTRSYLLEVDGYLNESPITWYTSQKKWGMSPGYDMPMHFGFERSADMGCVHCHSGRVEAAPDTTNRLTFPEMAIGCENCHGPGSLHQAAHYSQDKASNKGKNGPDLTIVNPGNLSPLLQEAICASCHLTGAAAVGVRGRELGDFRPGLPLTDFHAFYCFADDDDAMTVVGHVEQLRQSACYKKSENMTCLSCHDPHQRTRPKDQTAYRRRQCLNCHAIQQCSLDEKVRLAKDAVDNCVRCHMPRGDTDIPHIAFTHHRIGLHGNPKQQHRLGKGIAELVPIYDVSQLPLIDQRRNLGLAYMDVARDSTDETKAGIFFSRAKQLLDSVEAEALQDGTVFMALSEINYRRGDFSRARAFAKKALESPATPARIKATAMDVLAACDQNEAKFQDSIARREELLQIRQSTDDWYFLGCCYLNLNQPNKARTAFQKALAIRPFRPRHHAGLAESYRQLGDPTHAREHVKKARWLGENRQD